MRELSNRRLLAELESRESDRYVDMCLVARDRESRETILCAGGQWDQVEGRFTDRDPTSCKYVDLHAGQVPFVRWFAEWLARRICLDLTESGIFLKSTILE